MNTAKTSAGSLVFSGLMASLILPQISQTDQAVHIFSTNGTVVREVSWPIATRSDNISSVFQTLVARWKAERDHLVSSVDELISSQNYQAIIGLGEVAVPLILAQLKSEGERPDHWFVALGQLTGASPVPPEDRGRLRRMANAWIAWGKANHG